MQGEKRKRRIYINLSLTYAMSVGQETPSVRFFFQMNDRCAQLVTLFVSLTMISREYRTNQRKESLERLFP